MSAFNMEYRPIKRQLSDDSSVASSKRHHPEPSEAPAEEPPAAEQGWDVYSDVWEEDAEEMWSKPSVADLFCSPSLGGLKMKPTPKPRPAPLDPALLISEHHDYIRVHCVVPTSSLITFDHLIGVKQVVRFAEQYQPSVQGAVRAVSGLLLFGSSGTGKTACAQAITHHIGGTFYKFTAAHLPTGQRQAERIDALFDVAMSGCKPAVIFIDEIDTLLSKKATTRVGHFADRFDRFMEGVLVIGATNSPDKIAPKIVGGRLERKILVNPPNDDARERLIHRQLAQEEHEHLLSRVDMMEVVVATAGRSAVNMERLISTAVVHGGGLRVSRHHFQRALEEERSDYNQMVAGQNMQYDLKHGWRG